jgi:hypothetical protein
MADDITLQIRDQMTQPLKQIKGALDAARLATKGLDTQVHNLDKSQGNWAKAGKKQLGEFAPKIKETGANMSEMGTAAGLASGGAMLAVEGVKELASAAKELALSLVGATLKLIEFTAASARMREKNVANFSLMRGNAKLGRETYDMLGNIAARQHASQEQVFDYGKELLQAGIKPQRQLQDSVKSLVALSKHGTEAEVGKLKSVLTRAGEAQASPYGAWSQFVISGDELRAMGSSWDQYTAQLSKQFGRTITKTDVLWGRVRVTQQQGINAVNAIVGKNAGGSMIGGLEEVIQRAKDTLTSLFADVDTGPLMSALHELIDVFDPLTENGKNAKTGITNVMNGIIKLAGKLTHEFTLGFLKIENELLKLYLYTIPAINGFKKMWALHDGLGKLKMLFTGLVIIVALLGITTLIAFLPLILLVALLVAAVIGLALAFGWVKDQIDTRMLAIKETLDRIFNKETWLNMAADAIQGLVDGLTKGVKAVSGAAKAVGDAALGGVKTVLAIQSPSKAFAKLGDYAAQGFAQGFEMADAGLKISSPGMAAAGGGGATTILLGGVQIDINGATGPSGDWKQQLETQLADIFESAMLERGK